jgi:hypothetical protein
MLLIFQQVMQVEALGLALKALDFTSRKLQLRRQYPNPVFHVSQFVVSHYPSLRTPYLRRCLDVSRPAAVLSEATLLEQNHIRRPNQQPVALRPHEHELLALVR